MENSLDLVVPSSSTAKNSVSSQEVQTISVNRDSTLMFHGASLTAQELELRLSELYRKDPKMAVVIRADEELPLQKFIHVMDVLGRIGISQVGVMAHPEMTGN
jgi:biopolymer transport protein ExbD